MRDRMGLLVHVYLLLGIVMFVFRLQQLQKTEQMFKKKKKILKPLLYFGIYVFMYLCQCSCSYMCAQVYNGFEIQSGTFKFIHSTKFSHSRVLNQNEEKKKRLLSTKQLNINEYLTLLLLTLITHIRRFTLRESYHLKLLQNSTKIIQS